MDGKLILLLVMLGFLVNEGLSTICYGVQFGHCQLVDSNNQHLVCVGQSPTSVTTELSKNITNVTICSWPYRTFKVMWHLIKLKQELQHFTLTLSEVQRVDDFSSDFPALQSVNLSRLHLTSLDHDVFLGLPQLRSVDLRQNYLSYLDYQIFNNTPALTSLYLAGNNWTCDPGLIWLLDNCSECLGSKVVDKDILMCEGKTKAIPKPLLRVMKFIQVMQSQCPAPCNCFVDHVVIAYSYLVNERGKLLPHIRVNCNNHNLTSMPKHLPEYTTALYLRNNNLTSVEELVFNKHYQDLREIYLDNNQITAINILEGTHWLNNFGVFSLRGNRLRQIPLYALDHAFDSQKLSHIYLGNNPWRCDCKFTTHFHDFLKKYSGIIEDLQDIRCRKSDGDKNSYRKIINLQTVDLCLDQKMIKLTLVDKVNIFLASMICLVISVFLYNLAVYKYTGKLPWMVDKFF